MTTKNIFKQTDIDDAVKSFVFPIELTNEQKKLAADQLKQARKQLREESSPNERLAANLLQLKFQMEDYLNNKDFEENRRFGNFLKEYVEILNKKRNEFAHDISVHETLVSQLINNRRMPSEIIIIRLELHSNRTIPAEYWFRLVEKERIHKLRTNKILRTTEMKNVSNKVLINI